MEADSFKRSDTEGDYKTRPVHRPAVGDSVVFHRNRLDKSINNNEEIADEYGRLWDMNISPLPMDNVIHPTFENHKI